MEFQQVVDFLLMIWGFAGVKALVCTILINTVVAMAAAVKTQTFEFARVGEFLLYKILPNVVTYVVAKLFEQATGYNGLSAAVFTVLEITLAGDLTDSLDKLGIPWSQRVRKYLVKGD